MGSKQPQKVEWYTTLVRVEREREREREREIRVATVRRIGYSRGVIIQSAISDRPHTHKQET